MSGLYGVGTTDLATLQNAAAAPKLIRASKTFTGAANLGAAGVNELFTTTGAVAIDEIIVRCTTDLEDTVDGALFTLGVTGAAAIFGDFTGAFDLDTINAGNGLTGGGTTTDGYGTNLIDELFGSGGRGAIFDNIIMTISAQAITGGTLEFYILYRPLSSGAGLALGVGMVSLG